MAGVRLFVSSGLKLDVVNYDDPTGSVMAVVENVDANTLDAVAVVAVVAVDWRVAVAK